MSVLELAMKYYPRLWDLRRLESLAAAGRLTEEEVARIRAGKEPGGKEGEAV